VVPLGFCQHHPDILFSYLHRQQQDCKADSQDSEDPDHGIVWYCGVRCVSEQDDERAIYISKKNWSLSVLYIMVKNKSCHYSAHIHVTTPSVPGEEMTDIWSNCVVGSSANCDISKTINKTN